MEKKFAYKGIQENKSRFAAIFAVLLLCGVLLSFCTVLIGSINRTVEETRLDSYGTFTHYLYEDPEFEGIHERLAKVEGLITFGILRKKGTVMGLDLSYANEEAIRLGRIRLDEGRFPEAEDEIAMEPTLLVALGYPAELGQRVTFTVMKLGNGEAGVDPEDVVVEYTVTGLIHEYTSSWGFGLSAIISKLGSEAFLSPQEKLYLMECTEFPGVNSTKWNRAAYPIKDIEDPTLLLRYAVWMVAAVSATILLVCVLFSVLKHTETWRFFRDLGATKSQVQSIVLWEGFFLGIIALPAGTALGILGAAALISLTPSPIGARWYLVVEPLRITAMFGIALLVTAFGVGAASFAARQVPLLAGDKKIRDKKYKRRKSIGFMTATRLVGERMRAQRGMTALLFALLLSRGTGQRLCSEPLLRRAYQH